MVSAAELSEIVAGIARVRQLAGCENARTLHKNAAKNVSMQTHHDSRTGTARTRPRAQSAVTSPTGTT